MWPTRHADLRCSDYVDIDGSAELNVKWRALEGVPAATFCAYDAEQNCYVATLNEPSSDCGTLYSIDPQGQVRWQITSLRPSLTSLAIDTAGQLYFDDGTQIVCLDSLGNTLWRHPSVAETAAVVILADGNVFVQNILGQINIYSPDGTVLLNSYELDCKPMEDGCGHDHMPGKLGRMLFRKSADYIGVSKSYSQKMVHRFFGVGISAKHVPAIVPESNRVILVMALGDDDSCVYGLDVYAQRTSEKVREHRDDPVKVGFRTIIPGGSDTSPAISFDGERVYCTDGQGRCYCLSTNTGDVLWRLSLPGESSASPSVSPDGFIYFSVKSSILAIKDLRETAEIAWQRPSAELKLSNKEHHVLANSVLALSQRYVYSVVSAGRLFFNKLLPSKSYLVTLDRFSGEVVGATELGHESLCTLTVMSDGSVLIPSKPLLSGLGQVSKYLRFPLFGFKTRKIEYYGLVKLSPSELSSHEQ